jgi:hypothetical protein
VTRPASFLRALKEDMGDIVAITNAVLVGVAAVAGQARRFSPSVPVSFVAAVYRITLPLQLTCQASTPSLILVFSAIVLPQPAQTGFNAALRVAR